MIVSSKHGCISGWKWSHENRESSVALMTRFQSFRIVTTPLTRLPFVSAHEFRFWFVATFAFALFPFPCLSSLLLVAFRSRSVEMETCWVNRRNRSWIPRGCTGQFLPSVWLWNERGESCLCSAPDNKPCEITCVVLGGSLIIRMGDVGWKRWKFSW